MNKLIEKVGDIIFSKKFYGPILVIVLAIIFYNVIVKLINKLTVKGKTELDIKRRKTLILLFNNIMKYTISIIAILIILEIYGINTTSMLAGLGIIGLLVGLALQDALKDIIGGINIIMDNYYVVGDKIKYKDFIGTVISFGLKTTKIKSVTGDVLIITNRNVDTVINLSQKQTIMPFEITLASDVDHKIVKRVVEDILKDIYQYDYVDQKESIYLGIDKISEANLVYLFQVKCKQGKEEFLRREILEKIKISFDKNKIKLAG